jgi:hypothetical protein
MITATIKTQKSNKVQQELLELTAMSMTNYDILYYQTAFRFIDYVSKIQESDMSHLANSDIFWKLWQRKWNETDKLFMARLQQKTQNKAWRVTDKQGIGDYKTPFYYAEKFDAVDEILIFSYSEMLYHYKVLHQSEKVMTWSMASLINVYSLLK